MAFPTTNILDNFNRSNEGPPPSASWGGIYNNAARLKVFSNQCIPTVIADDNDARWLPSVFDPDCEVYATIANVGVATENFRLFLRANAGATNGPGANNYALYYSNLAGTDTIRIRRQDDATGTTLATFNQEVSNGDSVGMSAIGNILTAYYKSGAGAWASLGTYDISGDATKYTSSGYLGIDCVATVGLTLAIDDFGGGSYRGFMTTNKGLWG